MLIALGGRLKPKEQYRRSGVETVESGRPPGASQPSVGRYINKEKLVKESERLTKPPVSRHYQPGATLRGDMKRTGFIGGSDLGSIVNAPPYGCARKLWYQKRAIEPDYEVPFRGHLLRGVKLEPLIVDEYVAKTGNKVRRRKASKGIAEHEIGAMDRVILGDARGPGVLECKSANERAFREMQKSGIPLGYQLQIQWYMGLSEYRWGAFAILEPANWRFETFEVAFDPSAFALMREYVDRFWEMVQGDGEPDRLPASDSRCSKCEYRFSCQGEALLGSIDPDAEASEIPGIAALAAEYLSLRDVRDDAEAAMDQVKEEALRLLGDAASATAPGYRIVAKPQVSQRVDTNALKSKHPEVYQSVLKPSVSRPFRVLPA